MTLVTDIATRIGSEVTALAGRVEFVAGLAALVEANALPQREVSAFVLPIGFDDRGGDAASGMYTQMVQEAVGVVLCVKALGDAGAKRAVEPIDALKDAVINALAGWGPDGAVGVLRATRGRMVSVTKGLVIYQLDFALIDQLRIPR
jgi:hypothetical protein